MLFNNSLPKRKYFLPEIFTVSDIRSGPASLKATLEGFGIISSLQKVQKLLEESVASDPVTTYIDAAEKLGLEAKHCILPVEHLLLPENNSLPAIVISRLRSNFSHFSVLWRIHGPFVQVMDPNKGRFFISKKRFLNNLDVQSHTIPAEVLKKEIRSDPFIQSLCTRMEQLYIDKTAVDHLIHIAVNDPDWQKTAKLDAALRMIAEIVESGGIEHGSKAGIALEKLFMDECARPPYQNSDIPSHYWFASPAVNQNKIDDDVLICRGIRIIRLNGKKKIEQSTYEKDKSFYEKEPEKPKSINDQPLVNTDIAMLKALIEDGNTLMSILVLAIFLATFGFLIEIILLRGMIEIGSQIGILGQRVTIFAMAFALIGAILAINIPIESIRQHIGRRIEIRFRIALLKKIPRLGDKFFYGRPISDIGYKAYDIRRLKELSNSAVILVRSIVEIFLTTGGIIFIAPKSSFFAVMAAVILISLPFINFYLLINQQSYRFYALSGVLFQSYLDSLLGLIPIKTHSAERSMRREHEGAMTDWAHSGISLFKTESIALMIERVAGIALSFFLLYHFLSNGGESKTILILMYWTLRIPMIGRKLAGAIGLYAMPRSALMNMLELINAPDENEVEEDKTQGKTDCLTNLRPIELSVQNVSVQVAGQTILDSINLNIRPGEHVSVVGPSGAGKSSLVGLFLGWFQTDKGTITVDGETLDGKKINQIRKQIAWVEPGIQIWNRSLLYNLLYGSQFNQSSNLKRVIDIADLMSVLEKFPDGLHTVLGESGGLVSGGEGQRVRFGRALKRENVRLVILDEPFRGLDRSKRRDLLRRAREYWKEITLVFISHDVSETLIFDRVLVMENGRIIEDDSPKILAEKEDSKLFTMLKADQAIRKDLWSSADWKKLWLEDGEIKETL